jgi:hypothetical protein
MGLGLLGVNTGLHREDPTMVVMKASQTAKSNTLQVQLSTPQIRKRIKLLKEESILNSVKKLTCQEEPHGSGVLQL